MKTELWYEYYETKVYCRTKSTSEKGIEITVHWSNDNDAMQSNGDLKYTEQSKHYYPAAYGVYLKEASWWITGSPYSNTLDWRVDAIDAAGNTKTIMSGSNKNDKSGSMGTWSGYTATSISTITVCGNNKASFNLTLCGVNGTLNSIAIFFPNNDGVYLRASYNQRFKNEVENCIYFGKRLRETLISHQIGSAKVYVNSADDWYYETISDEDMYR